ncbi:hydroxymethylglutaryl-CoA lyase [Mucilaginibacter frigoritolerans]|jgi:hydroxymethylglutaryl-CoA lyase|uniref:Hydroxymethylglutaryl-CoA lyase n=1 Tax=Mucilaginibacter frigoritolerans TaxID=652788 RepID=A0A562UGH0_9SPHI|nr:hydroxymethylglutaryl-CoA lyase [Mucilaginibacter frigoritolerans]TWJ04719.1 hydroxymethylglutaryl-CoA lyase [Mucilaginibacter frigoritolerans]
MIPSPIKLTECPRDAMQGIHQFIPTEFKAAYINLLLQVGFDTIDFGSFVSAKAIPQMQDTVAVLKKLDLSLSKSKLLAIIANYRGAEEAVQHEEITYLGFPFSISETFQLRNANSDIAKAFNTVKDIYELCEQKHKTLRIYLSMGFGNPYGDEWNIDILLNWTDKLIATGIKDIYVADTVGAATPKQITEVMEKLYEFKNNPFGLHLHSTPDNWQEKIEAAYKIGCRWFDTALKGYGGCPMAADVLTGNIATEKVIAYLQSQNEPITLNFGKLKEAMDYSSKIFV